MGKFQNPKTGFCQPPTLTMRGNAASPVTRENWGAQSWKDGAAARTEGLAPGRGERAAPFPEQEGRRCVRTLPERLALTPTTPHHTLESPVLANMLSPKRVPSGPQRAAGCGSDHWACRGHAAPGARRAGASLSLATGACLGGAHSKPCPSPLRTGKCQQVQ